MHYSCHHDQPTSVAHINIPPTLIAIEMVYRLQLPILMVHLQIVCDSLTMPHNFTKMGFKTTYVAI